jgi:hypothetical protein
MPKSILGPGREVVAGSPLYCHGAIRNVLQDPAFCEESTAVLQHLQDLTILAVADAESLVMENAATKFLNELRTVQSDPPTLLRMIHLTGIIHSRALRKPLVPFSSDINQDIVTELCRTLESPIHDATFDQYPGILIWILLTTTAALDTSRKEHGFVVSLLTKVGLSAGYGWWEELQFAMRAFLKIKLKTENGGAEF